MVGWAGFATNLAELGLRQWVKAKQPSASRTRLSVKKRKWKHCGGSPKADSHQLFISVHFPYLFPSKSSSSQATPGFPLSHPAHRAVSPASKSRSLAVHWRSARPPWPKPCRWRRSDDRSSKRGTCRPGLRGKGYPGVGMVVLGMIRCLLFYRATGMMKYETGGGMEVSMEVVSVEPGCRIDVMEADLDWMDCNPGDADGCAALCRLHSHGISFM